MAARCHLPRDAHYVEREPGQELLRHSVQELRRAVRVDSVDSLRVLRRHHHCAGRSHVLPHASGRPPVKHTD